MRVMINVMLLNLKLFASQWMRLLGFLLLVSVLGGVGWLIMNHLSRGNAIHPVGVAIVDHDNSLETLLILQTITEAEDYVGLIDFQITDANEAAKQLAADTIAAIITFPENFGLAMTTGENLPFTVAYSPNRPLASSLIHIVAGAFADMLEASQTGVYTTLNFARQAELTPTAFDLVFWGVNLQFLGMIMARHLVFDVQQMATSTASLGLQYLFTGYVLMLLSVFLILGDKTSQLFSVQMVSQHGRYVSLLIGTWLAYVLLLLALSGLFMSLFWVTRLSPLFAPVNWWYLPILCFALALIGCFFIFAFKHSPSRNLGLVTLALMLLLDSDFNLWVSIATEPVALALLRFVLFSVGAWAAIRWRAKPWIF